MEKIKIFIAYHRPFRVVSSEIFFPILLGSAVKNQCSKDGILCDKEYNEFSKSILKDDTGVNISERNREYAELTGLYWIWKNYQFYNLYRIGYMSYRRLFIFNDLNMKFKEDRNNIAYHGYRVSRREKKIVDKFGLEYNMILNRINNFDLVLPYLVDLLEFNITSCWYDYLEKIPGLHIDDLCTLQSVMYNLDRKIGIKFDKYLSGNTKLLYQCFICTPNIFNSYCEFLFRLLSIVDRQIDTSRYTINGRRTLAYLGELLYGFYFTDLIVSSDISYTYLPLTFLEG
ncbi:MAG: DUF4422 domain-containing protein [Lachnospiraceae bacterium]|nr:DUF4422 domain-containing protein [Lachnospiraceae bacterium]